MMKIIIQTPVAPDIKTVFAGFNRKLFLALTPSFPPVELQQFGMEKGDEVRLVINLLGLKQRWVSRIVDVSHSDDEIYFVDEGVELPFFLRNWLHRHRIVRSGKQSLIIDDISYEGRFGLLTYLLYPVLYLQFRNRRAVYRRFFAFNTAEVPYQNS